MADVPLPVTPPLGPMLAKSVKTSLWINVGGVMTAGVYIADDHKPARPG